MPAMKFNPTPEDVAARKREAMRAWRAAHPEAARAASRRAYDRLRERLGLPPVVRGDREPRPHSPSRTARVYAALVRQGRRCSICSEALPVEPKNAGEDFRLDAEGYALAHDRCLRRSAKAAKDAARIAADDFPGVPALQARARAAVAAGEACGSCGATFGAEDDPLTLRPLDTWRVPGWRHAGCPRKPSAGP